MTAKTCLLTSSWANGEVYHLADSYHAFPEGQILGVDGLAMVLAPVQDVIPAPVQLRQRQTQLHNTQ